MDLRLFASAIVTRMGEDALAASGAQFARVERGPLGDAALRIGGANASVPGLKARDNSLVFLYGSGPAGGSDRRFETMWSRPDNLDFRDIRDFSEP
jgi:hypothetical protein